MNIRYNYATHDYTEKDKNYSNNIRFKYIGYLLKQIKLIEKDIYNKPKIDIDKLVFDNLQKIYNKMPMNILYYTPYLNKLMNNEKYDNSEEDNLISNEFIESIYNLEDKESSIIYNVNIYQDYYEIDNYNYSIGITSKSNTFNSLNNSNKNYHYYDDIKFELEPIIKLEMKTEYTNILFIPFEILDILYKFNTKVSKVYEVSDIKSQINEEINKEIIILKKIGLKERDIKYLIRNKLHIYYTDIVFKIIYTKANNTMPKEII